MSAVLLIDDDESFLKRLEALTAEKLGNEHKVLIWCPSEKDADPKKHFDELLQGNDVRLVVTDYDLTAKRLSGFFGATVVAWCQRVAVPVADFSRGVPNLLPAEPNVFELRVPVDTDENAANYIVGAYCGFVEIRRKVDADPQLLKQRSPAAALATMLGVEGLRGQFSQYGLRYGGANSALIDRFAETAPDDKKPAAADVGRVVVYIMGHLLINSILRFPGPILAREALAAYLAVDVKAVDQCFGVLKEAQYTGPFADHSQGPYFWTHKIDETLAKYDGAVDPNSTIETIGEQNRIRIEKALGKPLPWDQRCKNRCKGQNGGFLCPFSHRVVCQRQDCSVPSAVWIPQGARFCRFERGFYEEWSPVLGM